MKRTFESCGASPPLRTGPATSGWREGCRGRRGVALYSGLQPSDPSHLLAGRDARARGGYAAGEHRSGTCWLCRRVVVHDGGVPWNPEMERALARGCPTRQRPVCRERFGQRGENRLDTARRPAALPHDILDRDVALLPSSVVPARRKTEIPSGPSIFSPGWFSRRHALRLGRRGGSQVVPVIQSEL
jgi:hypothetical protein